MEPTPVKLKKTTTMHSILARFNFFTTLLAVTLAWLAILFSGMTALKSYADQNLKMAAQLATYGAEPGLVFEDAEAARQGVLPLLQQSGVSHLRIIQADGSTLVDEFSDTEDPSPFLTRMFMPDPFETSVHHNGVEIGRVVVWGDATALLSFARLGLLAGLGCLAITVFGTFFLRRRFNQELAKPLRAIATVAHDVRLHRRFDQRVSPVGVAELDRLGGDINALLDELEGWQGKMQNEHAALAHRPSHDPLTGLANRAEFDEAIAQRLIAAEASAQRLALIFIDADNFKEANDSYRHSAGDLVLQQIAARVTACLRPTDFAARLGGDEFVIILDPILSESEAAAFCRQLRHQVSQPMTLEQGETYRPAISVGLALYPDAGQSSRELLTAADAAMYADKFSNKALR